MVEWGFGLCANGVELQTIKADALHDIPLDPQLAIKEHSLDSQTSVGHLRKARWFK
jgi:hypothetical protein